MNKTKIICGTIIISILILTICFIIIANSEYKVIFDMDDNTLEAVKAGLEVQTTPTCEEGCYAIADSWIGWEESDMVKHIKVCTEYCAELKYKKSIEFKEKYKSVVS